MFVIGGGRNVRAARCISDFVSFPLAIRSLPFDPYTLLLPRDSRDQAIFLIDRTFAGQAVLTSQSYL